VKIVHQVLDGEVAGGQLVALQLAQAAQAVGHEVAFVSPTDGRFLDRLRADGYAVAVVPLRRSYRLDDALRLARLLRRSRADVLHTHGHLVTNVLARVAGRLAGVPVVAHMHIENTFRAGLAARLQALLDNATARLCARILVVSEATRVALERQGYPRGSIEVVPNGVDLMSSSPARVREEFGIPDGVPLLVQVGRLCDVKGQRDLVEALALLGRGAHAVLVGEDLEADGAFRRSLDAQIEESGLARRVTLAGYRPDARSIMAAADVVVLPSWIEGQPLVVLEAMAESRPVVATPVGGTGELVVDGTTGLLVPPRDPAALAAALGRLLDDPARARSFGEAGRRRVEERFALEQTTKRVIAVYRGLRGARS
jgi:glycosyltransferase involved in cell wall biosynthesis